jgi:alpha-tubulin suppressor-like RCC1 family protein
VHTGVVAISVGVDFSVILKPDGTVWSVGNNAKGQLGDGTNTNSVKFVKAKDLSG